jgi:peptidoglycan/xylan/chitin deacetylase (PgdA/CDA1 family)
MKRVFAVLLALGLSNAAWAEDFRWPQNQRLAISLSYDDALASQLDNAVPSLDKHNFKASFYVFPASEAFRTRLNEWGALAKNGHELGNHTLYHNCSKKLAGDWVRAHVDIDQLSVERMVMDVQINNTLLQALDGESVRTFTTPCGHMQAKDGNYVERSREYYYASKGQGIAGGFSVVAGPNGVTAKQMINYIHNVPENVKLINLIFHGIGGEHLSVDTHEHDELLNYLAKNKEQYWVDTYLKIMQHVKRTGSEDLRRSAGFVD